MTPTVTAHNQGDVSLRGAEFIGDGLLRESAPTKVSNRANIRSGQSRSPVGFSSWGSIGPGVSPVSKAKRHAAFSHSIPDVVFLCAGEEMVVANATPDIAMMVRLLAAPQFPTELKFKSVSMSGSSLPFLFESSVPVCSDTADPQPALRCFLNFAPESFGRHTIAVSPKLKKGNPCP